MYTKSRPHCFIPAYPPYTPTRPPTHPRTPPRKQSRGGGGTEGLRRRPGRPRRRLAHAEPPRQPGSQARSRWNGSTKYILKVNTYDFILSGNSRPFFFNLYRLWQFLGVDHFLQFGNAKGRSDPPGKEKKEKGILKVTGSAVRSLPPPAPPPSPARPSSPWRSRGSASFLRLPSTFPADHELQTIPNQRSRAFIGCC